MRSNTPRRRSSERALADLDRDSDLVGLLRRLAQAVDGDPGQRDHDGQQHDTAMPSIHGVGRRSEDEQRRRTGSRARSAAARRRTRGGARPRASAAPARPEPRAAAPAAARAPPPRAARRAAAARSRPRSARAHRGPCCPRRESDRQEHDARCARSRRRWRAPSAAPRLGGRIRRDPALEPALHGLVDHDAVVHEHADADRQTEQRDQVQRVPAEEQHAPARRAGSPARPRPTTATARHRRRNRNSTASAIRNPDSARCCRRASCSLDQLGRIEVDHEVDAVRRELRAQLVQARAQHRARGAPDSRPPPGTRRAPTAVAAVDAEQHLVAAGAELDVGDVAQQHRPSPAATRSSPSEATPRGPPVEDDRGAARLALDAAEEAQPPHRSGQRSAPTSWGTMPSAASGPDRSRTVTSRGAPPPTGTCATRPGPPPGAARSAPRRSRAARSGRRRR